MMRKLQRKQTTDKRISKVESPNQSLDIFDHYSHMFLEDLHNSSALLQHYGRETKYNAVLGTDDKTQFSSEYMQKLENLLLANFAPQGSKTLFDACLKFISNTVSSIVKYGEVFLEVTIDRNDDGLIENFDFHYIQPTTMKKRGKFYVQTISKTSADTSRGHHKKVRIPQNHILHITMPKELGGAKKHKRIMKQLSEVDPTGGILKDPQLLIKNELGISINDYHRIQKLEVYRLTRKFGWSARNFNTDIITEWYLWRRNIEFHRAIAILRENIINQLNIFLNNDFVKSGAHISIDGWLESPDFDKILKKMNESGTTFKEIVDTLNADSKEALEKLLRPKEETAEAQNDQ